MEQTQQPFAPAPQPAAPANAGSETATQQPHQPQQNWPAAQPQPSMPAAAQRHAPAPAAQGYFMMTPAQLQTLADSSATAAAEKVVENGTIVEKIAEASATAAAEKMAELQGLATSSIDAAKGMISRITGTKEEDLDEEETEFLEELQAESVAQLVEQKGAIDLQLTEAQRTMLSNMILTRRNNAKRIGQPTIVELAKKAILAALDEDSKRLYKAGNFSKLYGFAYDDFREVFGV